MFFSHIRIWIVAMRRRLCWHGKHAITNMPMYTYRICGRCGLLEYKHENGWTSDAEQHQSYMDQKYGS
jgi:hypothetical protein